MYKVVPKWEEERIDLLQEEAFAEAFNDIFECEESEIEYDSDDESWTSWSSWSDDLPFMEEPDYRLDDILDMQGRFRSLTESGIFVSADILNEWYDVPNTYNYFIYEDPMHVYNQNMFVSKHSVSPPKGRHGKRFYKKQDVDSFSLELICVPSDYKI